MVRFKKVALLLTSITIAGSIIVGCSANGLAIYDALNKAKKITSEDIKTDVTVSLAATGMSETEAQIMDSLIPIIDGTKISVHSKLNVNSAKTKTKLQSDISVTLGGDVMPPLSTTLWLNEDYTGKKPVTKELISVPTLLQSFVPDLTGKSYITYDASNVVNVTKTNPTVDYKKVLALQPKYEKFTSTYVKNYNSGLNLITYVTKKDITQNGKKVNCKIYNLKITDSTLKSLLHYTVNNLNSNKTALQYLKEYIVAAVKVMAPAQDAATYENQVNAIYTALMTNLPDVINSLNTELDTLNNIELLGSKGIDIQFAINSAGYIVNATGDMEVVLDSPSLNNVAASVTDNATVQSLTGKYTLVIHFNTDITNINKTVSITLPSTTKSNSYSMNDYILQQEIDSTWTVVDDAVASEDKSEIASAKTMVNGLPASSDKTAMLKDLNDALNSIYIVEADGYVHNAMNTQTLATYEVAVSSVAKLYTADRAQFQSTLNQLKTQLVTSDVVAAKNAIAKYSSKKTSSNKKAATAAIAKVKNSESATYLRAQLSALK